MKGLNYVLYSQLCVVGYQVEEEETVGDIDLFSLTPDGESLTVNPKWLHHLQERRLSEEGQPRKVKEGEDECR